MYEFDAAHGLWKYLSCHPRLHRAAIALFAAFSVLNRGIGQLQATLPATGAPVVIAQDRAICAVRTRNPLHRTTMPPPPFQDQGRRPTCPRWHLHFISTCSSWLNQVERRFPLITNKAIQCESFNSIEQLVQRTDQFVAKYNPPQSSVPPDGRCRFDSLEAASTLLAP